MAETQTEMTLSTTAWTRPKYREGRKSCGRDPQAGPGSCALWWEGCPKAEQRGCYLHWLRQNRLERVE